MKQNDFNSRYLDPETKLLNKDYQTITYYEHEDTFAAKFNDKTFEFGKPTKELIDSIKADTKFGNFIQKLSRINLGLDTHAGYFEDVNWKTLVRDQYKFFVELDNTKQQLESQKSIVDLMSKLTFFQRLKWAFTKRVF